MKRALPGLLIPLLLIPATQAWAGAERAGTTAANFLTLGIGARILGMAGATLGLSNGLASTAWNPAGLGFQKEAEVAVSHAALEDQGAQDWAGLGGRLGLGELRGSISGLFQSEGDFEGRDAANRSTGTFAATSVAMGGTLAYPIGRHVAVGVGGKWVRESLGPGSGGSGLAADAGVMVRAGMLGFGLAGRNLGGAMRFAGASFPMSSAWGAGLSLDHRSSGVRAGLDVNVPNDYHPDLRGGVEWVWREHLALRAGYRRELGGAADDALNGPAFGMSAGAYGLWLDYGYLTGPAGEPQHRMGLSLLPGRLRLATGDPFGQKGMPRDFDAKTRTPAAPAGKQR